MSVIDDLLANNEAFAKTFGGAPTTAVPARGVLVLTCMDARLDPVRALGLVPGDAHVLRNAGGLATDDAIRSITLSQRRLRTESIMVVHHTFCGMLLLDEKKLRDEVQSETGQPLPFDLGGFDDLDADVRATVATLRASPFLPCKDDIRGFVYDVETGRVREVS
jgi:carbonic anhydrase